MSEPITAKVAVASVTADGVRLDLSAYLEPLLYLLCTDRVALLDEIAEVSAASQHALSHGRFDSSATHELDALVQDLAARLPQLVMDREQAEQLRRALPVRVPGQRGGRSAA